MTRPFDTTVNIDGTEYQIVLEGSDIHLQSLLQDIILEGAKDTLYSECEDQLRKGYFENGRPAPFTRSQVEDLFTEVMAEYAYDHRSEGTILLHNLN